ncbi:paxillin-like isoform X2 [Narcine bancroftii]
MDPSTLSGFDFLTEFVKGASSLPVGESTGEPKPLPSGVDQTASTSRVQMQSVCSSLIDSNQLPDEGTGPKDDAARESVELSRDRSETKFLSPKSATGELDEIMACLAGVVSATDLPPHSGDTSLVSSLEIPKGSLDTMLGTLETDLKRLGVSTGAKGLCDGCQKPIVGTIITAMGHTWHPEHFVCSHCEEEIGQNSFYERDGRVYCNKDYQNLFSPQCAYCKRPILDKILMALDKAWHPEHFFCAYCGDRFDTDGYHEKDGKAYCRKDYFKMFAPKCGCCDRPVLDNYISALNNFWHPECFICRDCLTPFTSANFFEVAGLPYCEIHYHQRQGTLCSACQKPITGRCITAMGRRFHPEHLVCAFCLKQLGKGIIKEKNDKPYCNTCFNKLFF